MNIMVRDYESPVQSPPRGMRPEIARLIEALARDAVRREYRGAGEVVTRNVGVEGGK